MRVGLLVAAAALGMSAPASALKVVLNPGITTFSGTFNPSPDRRVSHYYFAARSGATVLDDWTWTGSISVVESFILADGEIGTSSHTTYFSCTSGGGTCHDDEGSGNVFSYNVSGSGGGQFFSIFTQSTSSQDRCYLGGAVGSICARSVQFGEFNYSFSVMASRDTIGVIDEGGWSVPEPETWAMLIVGFGLAGAALRRNRDVRRTLPAAIG